MSETKNNLKDLLQKLDYFQRNLNSENISDFENLIQKIQTNLSENHKIRFSKLSFYEDSQVVDFDNMDDDLPF